MILAHRIQLVPNAAQRDYFARAAGTARRVWNWALAEWQRQANVGEQPNAMTLKKRFNAIKYSDPGWLDENGQPWLRTIHRDAHAQPFANLARAWARYREQRHQGGSAYPPRFKKKGRCRDSFYLAKGVDLGVSAAATLSTGEKVIAPRPLKAALRRLRIRSRHQSRKLEAARKEAGIEGRIPKGTRLAASKNRTCGARKLARLHARIAHVRKNFIHKLTTRLCRDNQTVVVEDLNVSGMMANARLARAIADISFHEVRRQLQYKAQRYGTTLVIADRWYPSSKLCSGCGVRNAGLGLGERTWSCASCGVRHDRDVNAAINLQRLATGALAAQSALPVASPAATPGTVVDAVSARGGKVTPVRNESGQQDDSGQEENGVHLCTPS